MGDAFDKSDGDAGTMVTIMPRVDQTEKLLCLTLHQPVPAVWQAPCLHVRLTSRSSSGLAVASQTVLLAVTLEVFTSVHIAVDNQATTVAFILSSSRSRIFPVLGFPQSLQICELAKPGGALITLTPTASYR